MWSPPIHVLLSGRGRDRYFVANPGPPGDLRPRGSLRLHGTHFLAAAIRRPSTEPRRSWRRSKLNRDGHGRCHPGYDHNHRDVLRPAQKVPSIPPDLRPALRRRENDAHAHRSGPSGVSSSRGASRPSVFDLGGLSYPAFLPFMLPAHACDVPLSHRLGPTLIFGGLGVLNFAPLALMQGRLATLHLALRRLPSAFWILSCWLACGRRGSLVEATFLLPSTA